MCHAQGTSPPRRWIIKRGGLEKSGQRLTLYIGKTKGTAFFLAGARGKPA